jgi:hypothetical protein
MSYRIVQSYYKDLTKQSDEWVVDRLWATILNLYFTAAEDFGVEVQPRPAPNKSKEANDVTIAYVHHETNKRKALCLIENKRVEFEGQSAKWAGAKEQLTGYMIAQRNTTKQQNEDMFGVVTVGRYSRFYVLPALKTELQSYPGTNDDYFEFKKNEEDIIKILLQIKGTVSRPPSRERTTASRPGSAAGSRPGSNAGSRPGSAAGFRPGSAGGTR